MKKRLLILSFLITAALILTGCGDPSLKSIPDPALNKAAPTSQPATEERAEHTPTSAAGETKLSPTPTSPPTKTRSEEPNCTDLAPHPIGKSIAEKFDVTYEEVMAWYCREETFEDILLALQTSKLSDTAPEELLEMKKTQTWDDIWDALGVASP